MKDIYGNLMPLCASTYSSSIWMGTSSSVLQRGLADDAAADLI